jgi:hypothetical protein
VRDAALVAGMSRITTEEALRTVAMLSQYWIARERSADAHRWLGHGLRVAESEAGGGFGAAVLRAAFGGTLAAEQRMDDATPHILAALPELGRPEEGFMREATETLLELAMQAWTGDDWELSRRTATMAAEHGEMLGDPHVAIAAGAVAHCQFGMGVRNIADTVESRGIHAANAGKHVEAVRCLAASASHNHRLGRAGHASLARRATWNICELSCRRGISSGPGPAESGWTSATSRSTGCSSGVPRAHSVVAAKDGLAAGSYGGAGP